MRKCFGILLLLLFVKTAIAQKGIEALVQAEKNFAAYSVAHSTKEAFQQFIDSSSIMFDNGKPVLAIDYWNKREKNAGKLNWWPQFAEISASGDFGYTTGPWTYQNSIKDSIIARGQYTTVWHLTKKGEWKFLVDLGINNTQINNGELVIINKEKVPENQDAITHVAQLVLAENNFNKQLADKKAKAYTNIVSSTSVLTRNGFLPAAIATERKILIDSTPSIIKYKMDGWGISSVPDMGYSYGTTILKNKTENYFRIWRREKDGWKIAVEVLRY